MKKRLLTVLLAVCLVLALGTVTAMADDAVASVGGTEYSTLQEAIDAAEKAGGGTITLLRSVESGEITFDTSGEYILDLSGNTFTSNGDDIIEVRAGDFDLTIRNGSLLGPEAGTYGIYAYATNNNVTITLESVYLYATDQGLGVQGLNTNNNLIVRNSTVRCDGTAIYFPPISGDLVIEDSTITGVNNGIYVKGGNVTVSGNSRVSVTGQGNGVPGSAYTGGSGFPSTGIAIYAEGGYVASDGSPRPINVTIEGGTIESVSHVAVSEGHISNEDVQKLEIVGGTFLTNNSKSNVGAYIPEGSVLKQDDNGAVVVDGDMTAVARVDGIGFTDLAKAIAAADDGDTVTLLENSTGNTSVELSDGRSITLDMNGFDAGFAENANIKIYHGNLNITGSGMLYEESPYYAPVMMYGSEESVADYSVVTIGPNVTLRGWAGLFINRHNDHESQAYGIVANVYGTLKSVKDTKGAGGHALYINGTIKATDGNVPHFILDGATLITEDGNGMYLAGYAETEIKDSTITSSSEGSTGIEIRAGKLKISGDTVITGGSGEFTVTPNGNGSTTGNVALAVVQHTTKLPLAVVIEDGRFIGGAAMFEQNAQNNDAEAIKKINIEVTGGECRGQIYSENIDSFIHSGNFSSPVNRDYLADNLTAELYSRSNPEAPYSYYPSVAAAQAAAQPGDVITDLTDIAADAEDAIVIINYGNGDVQTINSKVGATITLTAPTRSGYEFRGWRDNSGELHKAGDVVTVNGDMTFTAVWSTINIPDTYDIEIADAANGSVDTSLSNASAGSTITITATPDSGYSVASVTVTGHDGRVDVVRVNATTYTFKMPAGDVTVRVTFTDSDALPFTDVSAGQWFYDAVAYVYTNGMMEGDSATTFNPDGTMTRAMFWAVLGRIDGATITGTNWAEQARDWAMAEGVSDGTDPNGLVTREQMVTMLWRYAVAKGYDVSIGESTNILSYADFGQISEYAIPAMQWGCGSGVITGVTESTLEPAGTATRAQCAAIFMRFDQM